MNLENKLSNWMAEDIISRDQARAIYDYEFSRQKGIVFKIFALGTTVLFVGIISLISANWTLIPSVVKIIVAFLTLLGLSWGAYLTQQSSKHTLFEFFILSINLFILCFIVLIDQVYNIAGSWSAILSLWALIASLPVFLSTKSFNYLIWIITMIFALHCLFFEQGWNSHLLYSLPVVLFVLIIQLKMSSGLRSKAMLEALYATCLTVTVFDVLACQFVGDDSSFHYTFNFSIVFGIVALLWVLLHKNISKIRLVLYSMILVVYPLFTLLPNSLSMMRDAVQIIFLALIAILLAINDRVRAFNLIIILIALKFLSIYIFLYKTLLFTGFGLVLSGLVIIGFGLVIYKFHNQLLNFIQKIDHED